MTDKQHGRMVAPIEEAVNQFNLITEELIIAYEFARRGAANASPAILEAKLKMARVQAGRAIARLGLLMDATLDISEQRKD